MSHGCRTQLIYAEPGKPVYHAFTMIWPLVCRRLEGCPNITSAQLFDELSARTLRRRVQVWRREAIQRLICRVQDHTQDVSPGAPA